MDAVDATRTIDDRGGVGLNWEPFRVRGSIGYLIAAEFEGRGLVTLAVPALLDVGFREIGLHRIEIKAGTENRRSRAIPERLGFVREGVERGSGKGASGYHDLVVYSILEDEWPPKT